MKVYAAIFLLAVLMQACSGENGITEEQAVASAESFIQEHVKFFARNGTAAVDVPEYSFRTISVEPNAKEYAVQLHVSGVLGNETKESNVNLTVSREFGIVTALNGKSFLK